jgi:hypothetical protein
VGVTGIELEDRGLPVTRYSTSNAGVKSVASGVGPATLIPGIVDVMVDAMNMRKRGLPFTSKTTPL